MKILLAPSETKHLGGDNINIKKDNFFLSELFENRMEVFERYKSYVLSLDETALSKWFGLKNLDDVNHYKESFLQAKQLKAIQRYTGVAFDAIDYQHMNIKAQEYVDKNVIIFSNLFGPLLASDKIPDYKYKQGSKLPDFNIEKFYKDHFTKALDEFLSEDIIDLRAAYYDKYYKVTKQNVLTFKFLKDGKIVSHWAKHYRGLLLNILANNDVQSIEEFMCLDIPSLQLNEIQEKKNIRVMVMDIK